MSTSKKVFSLPSIDLSTARITRKINFSSQSVNKTMHIVKYPNIFFIINKHKNSKKMTLTPKTNLYLGLTTFYESVSLLVDL